ncbi:MAG: fibronectin type III domain-containing protein, partial [Planctomycetota bacterium]
MLCRRVIMVASLVAVLGSVNTASAVNWDFGANPDSSWCTPANWQGDAVPGDGDTASILGAIPGPTIDCDVNVGHIEGPLGDGQTVTITSGDIVVHNLWSFESASGTTTIDISGDPNIRILGWGYYGRGWTGPADACGVLNISGDPNIYVQDSIRAADDDNSSFHINMSGGYLSCNGILIGDNGAGKINITGGTVICRGTGLRIRGRQGVEVEFTLDGEDTYVEVAGGFTIPGESDAVANLYFNNGTLVCGDFGSSPGALWSLDIDDALIKILGDETEKMQGYVDDGRITGYDGTATPSVVWDGVYTLVGNGIPQEKAYGPQPGHNTGGLCPNSVTISWTPGQFCVDDHNVYFGTSWDDVNEGTTTNWQHYGSNSITLTDLEVGRAYFWRVDEVNDSCDASPWIGGIWQFSTEGGTASDPSPPNFRRGLKAEDVDSLSWSTHCIADTHNLYYATDLPASIVLFEDDFESGAFEPNWTATSSWAIFDANGDPNFGGRDANMATATGSGDLITANIDATNGDPCAMNISFY